MPPQARSRLDRLRSWAHENRAQLTLVTLAVTIPELLTGSTPVWNLINPVAVLGLLGFYGAGSLLIRDLALRWKNGWAGVLPLGIAYGIAEEGIATKTMVYPHSSAAGYLATYGHFLGVSWVFAVVIALFHALFSIALPILLVELLYPETRGHRFLTDRGLLWALGALTFAVIWGFFGFVPNYFEGYLILGFLLGVMALFVIAARFAKGDWLYPRSLLPRRSPRWFLGLGIAFGSAWLLFYLVAPHLLSFPLLVIAGELGSALVALFLVVREAGRSGNSLHKVYFAFGLLSWLVPWDFVVTFALQDYLVGAVLAAAFLVLFRLRKRYLPSSQPAFPPSPMPAPTAPAGASGPSP
ncbi:MAG: hypothetical protein KGJ23_12155 [Euryarchaeota archaeon]|nr:hypothetical protein [Euryarchaeota archaeon]MDE1837349.1 hypothetical protein [Euryarchaeota archaeon]MDE1880919.1 hypothetical protein [Euryarchaeota archaeon]MDE2045627.1 hypothetical protein [Thermoplasmata archaeon]